MRAIILTLGIIISLYVAQAVLTGPSASGFVPTISAEVTVADEESWSLLASVEIEEIEEGDFWEAKKTFPPALIAASRDFQITGYSVPVTAEPFVETFILVEDPDSCPFCGSSGYGPVLEVVLKRPMGNLVEFTQITVQGQLELIDDPMTYQSYRLVDAVPQ